ncbi:MAG: hypothetical protein FWD60_02880, partial [Candidatus Azobacteroides sp.]|nr:hypothetical protein [Candidatus Azobacteroides sp.]
INEDGSAKKKVITIDGPSIGGSGNLKLNDVGIECNASLASAKAYLSYVQSPKLDVNNLYGSLNIHQQEIGIIIGADAGVKGKVAVGKKGAEASAIVTVGIGWENHETKQNFNQLPKSITNRVYLDYLDDRNSIFYSKTMDSNWADNRGNSIRGTYHNASEQDIEKATEKTRDELLSSPKE